MYRIIYFAIIHINLLINNWVNIYLTETYWFPAIFQYSDIYKTKYAYGRHIGIIEMENSSAKKKYR